jgi:hypothetical protein
MSRTVRTSLALVLLLALPVASFIASDHVHERTGAPTRGPAAPACACTESATPQPAPADGPADGDADQDLCPICELARSLHAAGPPALLPVPVLEALGSAPRATEPRMAAAPSVRPASRSPPIPTTAA